MTFEEYWGGLETASWFAAYGDPGRAWFRETLSRYWQQGPHLAVYGLGLPAYDSEWLAERREAPQLVVKSFAEASSGQFRPINIRYEYFKKGEGRNADNWCRLSFEHDGNAVEAEFPWLGGEAEPAMTALCNVALTKAGSPYRFFDVESGDQCCYVALVTPEAYQAVKSCGWLTVRELPGKGWGAAVE